MNSTRCDICGMEWKYHGTTCASSGQPGSQATGTEAEVCKDIAERQIKGIQKYGISVAENPLSLKQWLQHAYEETLDQAIYLKRAIKEMEKEVT